MTTRAGASGAANDRSSVTFSRTVCRRRAPMSSVSPFTSCAMRASSRIPSSGNSTATPSVANRAAYCLVSALDGSTRIRTKSASVSGASSTRIGSRPCSSGIRSEGLLTWKAPAAMNSTWSVRTGPYLVVTVEPSMIGRMSRCTPSRDTSGPAPPSRPAILSSSSMKTMPDAFADDLIHVDQLLGFFRGQDPQRLSDGRAPALPAPRQDRAEQILEVDAHLLDALAGKDLQRRRRRFLDVEFDLVAVELAPVEPVAHRRPPGREVAGLDPSGRGGAGRRLGYLPGPPAEEHLERVREARLAARGRHQNLDQAVPRMGRGALLHGLDAFGLHHLHGGLGEIADHRVDVAADVADFGELGRLDLDERRPGEPGEPPRDLGLADAGRPDHEDVLRNDLVPQLRPEAAAAVPVAQRDRDRPFGRRLADDELIELLDDPARRQRLDGERGVGTAVRRTHR